MMTGSTTTERHASFIKGLAKDQAETLQERIHVYTDDNGTLAIMRDRKRTLYESGGLDLLGSPVASFVSYVDPAPAASYEPR